MKKHLNLAIIAIAVATSLMSAKAEQALSKQDHTELTNLHTAFFAEAIKGNISSYPKYIDEISLIRLMKQHRSLLYLLLRTMPEKKLEEMLVFTPSLDAVLQERNSKKYFEGIKLAGSATEMTKLVSGKSKVVAIAGNRSKAYIVVEGVSDLHLTKDEHVFSVWPAVYHNKQWKLDVTSNLVRDMRLQVKKMEARLYP